MRRLPLALGKVLTSSRERQLAVEQGFEKRLQQEDVDTTCRKGCHHCCYHPVAISAIEGTLLYLWLDKEGLWTKALKEQLQKHASLVTGMPVESWMVSEIPCPLLKNTLCLAYKARPVICRTTASTGLPDLCAPRRFDMNTPLVKKLQEVLQYQAFEKDLLKGQATYRTLPISVAVLVGREVIEKTIELDELDGAVYRKYQEAYL